MARPPAPVCKAVRRPLGVQSDRRGGLHIRPMPHCRIGCTSAKRTFVGVDMGIGPYGRNHWTPARIGARFRAAIQAAPTGGCSLV